LGQVYKGETQVGNRASLPADNVAEYTGPARPRPHFAAKIENFPLELPPGKDIGRIIAVSRAPNGDIYLLNYSTYGPFIPRDPAARLPWIVRFDSTGRYITGWGEEAVPKIDGVSQWPGNPENVEVDDNGDVWVTGWGPDDNAILKFTKDGKFIRQYGRHAPAGGDESTTQFNRPPSVYHDVRNKRLFVADGYGGHRVVVLDSETGKFITMWGANGKPPSSMTPTTGGFGNPTHKVAIGPNGHIYICDRVNNRVQEFEYTLESGAKFIRQVVIGPGSVPPGAAADVAFSHDGKFMFVSDMTGGRIWSVNHKTFEVVGWSSGTPELEGVDNIGTSRIPFHRMAILPNGDLLVTRGRKGIQRMKYLGVS
jgi:sugar lactone lactonase YvrE